MTRRLAHFSGIDFFEQFRSMPSLVILAFCCISSGVPQDCLNSSFVDRFHIHCPRNRAIVESLTIIFLQGFGIGKKPGLHRFEPLDGTDRSRHRPWTSRRENADVLLGEEFDGAFRIIRRMLNASGRSFSALTKREYAISREPQAIITQ